MTHKKDDPRNAWRHFNHETRLVLHTLEASLQMAKRDASGSQIAHLETAERCAAAVLHILESYANSEVEGASQHMAHWSSVSSVPSAVELVLPAIPAGEFDKFQSLVASGKLLEVEHWATDLSDIYTEYTDVCDAIGYYASMADLPSLCLVAERWRKQLD